MRQAVRNNDNEKCKIGRHAISFNTENANRKDNRKKKETNKGS